MTAMSRIEDFVFWVVTASTAAIASGVLWLIRRVFTNQKQIELLQAEIRHRDDLRKVDREDMAELKASVKRIEGRLMEGKR